MDNEKKLVKRRVRVDALVEVTETDDPQDQGAAYAVALAYLAGQRLSGGTRRLVGISYPLLEFAVDSVPQDGG